MLHHVFREAGDEAGAEQFLPLFLVLEPPLESVVGVVVNELVASSATLDLDQLCLTSGDEFLFLLWSVF